MILEITAGPDSLVIQRCAACEATRSIKKSSLYLGFVSKSETVKDPNLIVLPACACGAQEFLTRTFDEAPEGLASHRKKVNALAANLIELGQVHPNFSDAVKGEKRKPAQVGELVGRVDPPVKVSAAPEIFQAIASILPTGRKEMKAAIKAMHVDAQKKAKQAAKQEKKQEKKSGDEKPEAPSPSKAAP